MGRQRGHYAAHQRLQVTHSHQNTKRPQPSTRSPLLVGHGRTLVLYNNPTRATASLVPHGRRLEPCQRVYKHNTQCQVWVCPARHNPESVSGCSGQGKKSLQGPSRNTQLRAQVAHAIRQCMRSKHSKEHTIGHISVTDLTDPHISFTAHTRGQMISRIPAHAPRACICLLRPTGARGHGQPTLAAQQSAPEV